MQLHVWDRKVEAFEGAAKQLLLVANQDGHLELMYVGTDDGLYHNWQLSNTSDWAGELPF